MKLYITEYRLGKEKYKGEFFADDDAQAQSIAKERGIGEKIIGSKELQDSFDKEKIYQLLHHICFMSFIAIKSGKAGVDEILSDRGILHEAIHFLDGSCDAKTVSEFNKKLHWLKEITYSAPLITV